MAQIIKHRRGSIGALKDVTANVGELVMATGSIGDLNAPVLFIGSDAVAGGYKPVSKIYQGTGVPTLGSGYGSTMDGTPFYSNSDKTLYILDHNGNINMDLTGNIEGNTIKNTTINQLTSSFISASNTITAATGSFGQINLATVQVDSLTEGRVVFAGSGGNLVDFSNFYHDGSNLHISGDTYVDDYKVLYANDIYGNNGYDYVNIYSENYAQLNYSDTNYIYVEGSGAYMETNGAEIYLNSYFGNVHINSQNGAPEGDIYIGHGANQTYISGNTHTYGTLYVDDTLSMFHDGEFYIQDTDGTGIVIESTNYTQLGQQDGSAYVYTDPNYLGLYGANKIEMYSDNAIEIFTNNSGGYVSIDATGGEVKIGTENGSGDVYILHNGQNQLYVSGSSHFQSTIHIDEQASIYHDGPLYIEDYGETGLYVISNNYTQIGQSNNTAYLFTENDYAELYSDNGIEVIAQGNLDLYSENGNSVYVSAYGGGTLYLNEDGGEGDVRLGNGSNAFYTNNTSIELSASSDAGFYMTNGVVENNIKAVSGQGSLLSSNNDGTISGVSARQNGSVEVTGSLYLQSTVYIDSTLEMYHDGQFFINDTDGSGISIETNNGYTQVGQTDGSGYFYSEYNYAEIYGGNEADVYAGNTIWIYTDNNSGSINIAAPGDGTLYLNNYNSSGDVYVLTGNGNKLYVEGDIIQTGSFYQSGSITTSGDITLRGNINIGDNLNGPGGDIININAEISSSLIPSGSGIFDLGRETNQWGELWVSGTAHIGTLDLGSIQLNSLALPGDLTVSGTTALSGSVYLPNLNTNKLLFTDGNGKISTDSNNLETDGSYLYTYGYNGFSEIWLDTNNYAEIGWGDETNYVYFDSGGSYLVSYQGDTWVESYNNGDNVRLYSHSGNVYIDASNTLYINNDTNSNVQIDGNTYINRNVYVNPDYTLYASTIWDNTDGDNYLKLFGNPDNSGWWKSNTGADTTLANTYGNANLSILKVNSGNINIVAENGEVNLSTTNGFNVTGSMIVSDGSGVFNSSLVVNNSDLTLDGGSNQHMNDGAHLYFDTCVDIYWNNSNGDLIFYNDCNAFQFQNSVSVTGSLNVSNQIYSDIYRSRSNNNNALYFAYDSPSGAAPVELWSDEGDLSLYSDNNRIRMSGSVYFRNDIQVDNGGTIYSNYIGDYNNNGLTIHPQGNLILSSLTSGYVEMSTFNEEGGTNYTYVDRTGITLKTFDTGSELEHTVYLDNTGSLKLTNVDFMLSGSLNVDGNSRFNNDLVVGGDMYVSGNFSVLGTGSVINLTSSQVDIGTNLINLNTYAPFERFAGINVYDSGSNVGVTGSLLWDSQYNVWIYANPSGSSYRSARFISGPQNTGSLGEETGLTVGHIPVAVGDDHIGDSPLTYIGTTLALNTNKFTVDSGSGDTLIQGNFTIQGVGGTDNGEASSYVVFRNSDDVLGFVDVTDTGNVMDQILGYDSTTGKLEFSSLIDGGLY